MKKIIATSLFLALFLFSGFAYASSLSKPCCIEPSGACCPINSYQRVFTNPHTGWVTVPVENQFIRCSSRS